MINIEQANETAVSNMMSARPILTGVGLARDLIPGMRDNLLLHAGPPITWERMSGPLRGAVIGALIFEGLAKDDQAGHRLVEAGKIDFEPCHHHNAVGPMAGVTSSSMKVYEIENTTHGNKAYSNLNEGYGKVLRYGAYSAEVIAKLHWMNDVMGPVLADALALMENGIDMRALLAETLHMGDEGHNRNKAGSILFLKLFAPYIPKVTDGETAGAIMQFMGDNALTVLNPVMAACKAMADAAHGVEGSTVITAMARNGTDFGIRVSGLGEQWFTDLAGVPRWPLLPWLLLRRRQPRHWRQHHHRDGWHWWLCDGFGSRHRHLHQRHAARCTQYHAGNVRNHGDRTHAFHHSAPGFSRYAHWHRHSQGCGTGHHAAHQHRHRPQGSGHRPGRRGAGAAADVYF